MLISIIAKNQILLANGLLMTLELAFYTIILSFLIGTILGSLRYVKLPVISFIATLFIEITRAIPLVIYLIFIHFTISTSLYENISFIDKNSFPQTMLTGLIGLTLFTSAYIAEIIRSGLNSIEKEQLDSAKSLGFNTYQILLYIIVPLSVVRMMPALSAQFITLIKDTSLVSTIGLIELTRSGQFICENYIDKQLEILIVIAAIYFIICTLFNLFFKYLHKKLTSNKS